MVDCPYPYFDYFKLKQIIQNPLNDERNLKTHQNTIIHHFKIFKSLKSKPLAGTKSFCRGPQVRFRTACTIWTWLIKRFNFKDGSYPYDTKCVSDYIDNKYSKTKWEKKNQISVPKSPRGGVSELGTLSIK